MEEIWKQFNLYPNYEISNLGRVRNIKSGRIRVPFLEKAGYLTVHLSNKKVTKVFRIHRLVAMVFIANPNDYPQVNHIDCNKQNNKVCNLEWATAKENTKHAYRNNRYVGAHKARGEDAGKAVLNEKQVREIRKLYKTGNYSYKKLTKLFPVAETTIRYVIKRVSWNHIK